MIQIMVFAMNYCRPNQITSNVFVWHVSSKFNGKCASENWHYCDIGNNVEMVGVGTSVTEPRETEG